MIFVQGRKVPLKTFFNVTSILLIFVAAGMFTYGVHELESAKVIPYIGGSVQENSDNVIATRMNGDEKVFTFENNNDNNVKNDDNNDKIINNIFLRLSSFFQKIGL